MCLNFTIENIQKQITIKLRKEFVEQFTQQWALTGDPPLLTESQGGEVSVDIIQ